MQFDHELIYTEAWNYIQALWKRVAYSFDEISPVDRFNLWIKPLFTKLGYAYVYTKDDDSFQYPEMGHLKINFRQTDDALPLLHVIRDPDISSFDFIDNEDPEGNTFHDQCQRFVNTYPDYKWMILTNGKLFRVITKYAHAYNKSYLQFDLQNIIEQGDQKEFALFYRLLHKSRFNILRDYDIEKIVKNFESEIQKNLVSIPTDLKSTLQTLIFKAFDDLAEKEVKDVKQIKKIEKNIEKQFKTSDLILTKNNSDQIKEVFKIITKELKSALPFTSEKLSSSKNLVEETISESIYEIEFSNLSDFLPHLEDFIKEVYNQIENQELLEYDEAILQAKIFQWNQAYHIHEKIQNLLKRELKKLMTDELNKIPLIDSFLELCKKEGEQIGKILSKNVTLALEQLGNGLMTSNLDFEEKLISEEIDIDQFYTEILRIVYRILFILYGDERKMFPGEGTLFHQYYSFAKYREKLTHPILEDQDQDNWANFLTILNILEKGNEMLQIKGYGDFFSIDDNFPIIQKYSLFISNSAFFFFF